jgi:hypothetical protein
MKFDIFFFAALFAFGFLVVVLEFVRTRKLKEQYSLLWLLIGGVMILLALWKDLLNKLAYLLDIYYAPSLLFMVGILFSFILILHYSIIISKLHTQNVRMAQEIGVMNKKIDDLNKKIGGGTISENHPTNSA